MDMSKLRDSLPAGGRTDAERDLTNDFKAAALSITKLYKSSLSASVSAWSAGYQAALSELLEKLDGPVTADDIREWARARVDAIGGGASSGEMSDEERERERERGRDERERNSVPPPVPSSKPSSKVEEAPDRTPTASGRPRVEIYTDAAQETPDEERSPFVRSPSALITARTPFSSPTPVTGPTPQPASTTKTRSRRSHPLRDTTSVNPFPIATTFAPALPVISEFPFFPASMFESTQPAQYGPGMKRRHESVDDTTAAAGRKARMRDRGSGDSMDVDSERDRKRRR
ncbi:hypothetical protein CALVIDRAFT_562866 [Calocera viscosa TUFC12733]|uniref:Uncharacterized protein n=1 Tax=Calocera viscosa (strain TUFC12733) TaxID=1330018 RepID=A0A167NA99_CALVF|nr:hypothetical protein CALVIDRAFT_562866 [Calocera viscosa TUFC12733]